MQSIHYDLDNCKYQINIPENVPDFTDQEVNDFNHALYLYDSAVDQQDIETSLWKLNQIFVDFTKLYYVLGIINKHYLTGKAI